MSCTIVLDNDLLKYHSGSTVEGKVVFKFTAPETVQDIVVELIGQEETNWSETVENGGQSTSVDYKGSNVFLTIEKSLSQGGSFEAGTYDFPFKFDLPRKIPGTYTCQTGLVKFFIKATANTLLPFSYWVVKEITVKSPIYIEELEEKWLVRHFETAERTNSSLWCIASGPTTLDVFMSRRAFAQGEIVRVKADLTNMSDDAFWRVEFFIGQTIKSKSRVPKVDAKTEELVLVYEKLDGVEPYSQRAYEFNARIPRLGEIPNFTLCQLFSRHCYLKVVAVAKSYNLTVSSYIVIGDHHPDARVSNNHPVDEMGGTRCPTPPPWGYASRNAYNPTSTTSPRFRGSPVPVPDESYPLMDDLEDPPPSYDTVCKEASKKPLRRVAEAAAEVVPSAPPQTPPTQISVPYPPAPSMYPPETRPNVTPYPMGDPLAEWTRNRPVTGDTTAPVSTAAEPSAGSQSDDALYPPPMGSVKPSDNVRQQKTFTSMPMPQNELYLPPMSNIAPYPNVPSSTFASMPLPSRAPYPPEQKTTPYPTEDPLSKWNQMKSAVTDVTYSTISFPSVPKESPTLSDDEVAPAREMVAELSDPIPNKVKEPQREPVEVPQAKESENEVASSTSNPTLDDSLAPPPTDTVEHSLDPVTSPLPSDSCGAEANKPVDSDENVTGEIENEPVSSSAPEPVEDVGKPSTGASSPPSGPYTRMPMPGDGIYPPRTDKSVVGSKTLEEPSEFSTAQDDGLYPPPMDAVIPPTSSPIVSNLTDPDGGVASNSETQPASVTTNSDGLYPPPMDAVKPPVASSNTSLPSTSSTTISDGLYPPPKQSVGPDSNSTTSVPDDGLYPPPLDAVKPPVASSNATLSSTSSTTTPSSSDGLYPPPKQSFEPGSNRTTSVPDDGLYPPPLDAVKPPAASLNTTLPSISSTTISDGLYPPPKESVGPGSNRATSVPDDGLYPPPVGAGTPHAGSFGNRGMPVPGDGSDPAQQDVFRPLGFVTSHTAASLITGLGLQPQENAIGFAGLEDVSSSSASSKDAAKVPSTEASD